MYVCMYVYIITHIYTITHICVCVYLNSLVSARFYSLNSLASIWLY